MRTQHTTTAAFLILLLAVLVPPHVGAGRLPSFEQIYASNDKHKLTAWGRRYARGVGVVKDARKAAKLFCKSAHAGDTDAKFELGQLYAFGQGVKRDWELAAVWYHEAVEGKSRKARAMLKILKIKRKPKRVASCPLHTEIQIVGGSHPAAREIARVVRSATASRPHPASGKIAHMVRSMAPKYRLDPNLVLAVVETESGFNPKALSAKNAQGLMQLIPATAARFGVKDVWDPEQNLKGGMAYLRWLLDHFDGNLELALAGYNAGERAVERHGGIPPYAETQAYVERIIKRIGGRS